MVTQDNSNRERKGGEHNDGWKKKGNDDAVTEDEDKSIMKIIVPTKIEDGGRTNQGQDQGQETSPRTDAFSTYSDDDTRMLTLLGLEPAANPNDGEQEDWRQLSGFTGVGRRINDEDETTPKPRKTRLSFELHPDVFLSMWFERGELDL